MKQSVPIQRNNKINKKKGNTRRPREQTASAS